jgi:hypothetical protein
MLSGRKTVSANSFEVLQENEEESRVSEKHSLASSETKLSPDSVESTAAEERSAPVSLASSSFARMAGSNLLGGNGKGKQKQGKKLQTQNDTDSVTMGVTERILKQITDIYETGTGGGGR